MKIDMLGIRVDDWEISNTDPDQTCAISPRQLVALLKALESACEDRNRPTQSSPLSSWLEGFEAGCEWSRNRQGLSLSFPPTLLQAAAAFSPVADSTPSQPEMPVSSPSGRGESTASRALSDSDQGSSDSSASSCVEADKVGDTGDGVMSSPGITAGSDDMPKIIASVATLTRLSAPVTEEERAAFSALPPHVRADILARTLEAMRVLYRTKSDGVYFVFATPVRGFNPQTFCLTEGPDGARHELPAYETPWQP
ncbi:hypothetical protein K6L44_16195 [Gluconacetobacter entanii]|uniref:hypothetical protein n=1 Tax=Gluconacetobacter entanii TaxID=108528 RepID=UPI001C935CF6|nr:hypothetical protein [Gluconacetobacter entanii]MBY4641493.1 hypothetical protein [Gluconacetobacter entanii]MCW4581997.1 hypothetical protein [Gluconacetobacter entanii]MCW4585261.1 hypothetical protein [Gluconacetobacter entanii]MCW4588838.1 hypothetical protein [Gluconacetobacter entanii]